MSLAALTDTQLYVYLAIGGGVAVLLAVVLYFLPAQQLKVPAVALGVLAGLATGLGLGVLLMVGLGYSWESSRPNPPPAEGGAKGGPPPGFKLGPPGGKKQGPKGPTPTQQLAELLSKLDMLTGEPPKVTLNPKQKKAILEKLDVVAKKKGFDDPDAISALSILLDNLKNDRATLEAVGFRWPGEFQGSEPPPRPPEVPLVDNPHLQALRKRLSE
jgi:hypothetical protein